MSLRDWLVGAAMVTSGVTGIHDCMTEPDSADCGANAIEPPSQEVIIRED